MSKAKLAIALSTLCVATVVWAVPIQGPPIDFVSLARNHPSSGIPLRCATIGRRINSGGWINGAGPFLFAIDTRAQAFRLSAAALSIKRGCQ